MQTHGFTALGEILSQTPPPSTSSTATGTASSETESRLQHALEILAAAATDGPTEGEWDCPDCGGLGAVVSEPSDDQRYGPRYERCHCVIEAQRMRWWEAANIPPKYRPWSFASYRALPGADTNAADAVERWAETDGTSGLILFGDSNRGKTALAIRALEVRIFRHGQRAWFVKCPDLLNHIRDGYDREAGGLRPSEIMDRARTMPLLVLDDLGAEQLPRDTSWVGEQLYNLLDRRNDYQLPTIVTTNLGTATGKPIRALAERLGGPEGLRIASRVMEHCGPHVVRVQGANQRQGVA